MQITFIKELEGIEVELQKLFIWPGAEHVPRVGDFLSDGREISWVVKLVIWITAEDVHIVLGRREKAS